MYIKFYNVSHYGYKCFSLSFRLPKKYSFKNLAQAVGTSSLRLGHLTASQASREYRVPRMTVSDHVKQPHMRTTTGPPLQLSKQYKGIKDFALYCTRQRFPLTR